MKIYRYYCIILLTMLMGGILVFPLEEVSSGEKVKGGQVCMECHPEVRKEVFSQNGHRPAERGNCVECHNPHTAKHDNLLSEIGGRLCYRCHKKEKKEFAREHVHLPVGKGECTKCHRPHSSINKSLLIENRNKICFSCHPQEKIFSRKNIHSPLKKGNCMKCHDPHASDGEFLLAKDGKKICISCHSVKDPNLVKSHNNYQLKGADCLGCHNPHSSNNKSLVREFFHKPFAAGKCNSCHLSSGIIKKGDKELCFSCHPEVKKEFQKVFSHIRGVKGNVCLECHNSHVSDEHALKKARDDRICFSCHSDTKKRVMGTSPEYKYKHPKFEEFKCTSCHQAHGSDYRLLLSSDENSSCGNCHEAQGKFTHPIGKESIDPRSKRGMTCITCHNPMGAIEEFALRFGRKKELCTQCHRHNM